MSVGVGSYIELYFLIVSLCLLKYDCFHIALIECTLLCSTVHYQEQV